MTGLDPDTDVILEIYCFITDGQLNLVKTSQAVSAPEADAQGRGDDDGDDDDDDAAEDPGWGAIVHADQARLDRMDDWCTSHHGLSGLTQAVLASTTTHEQAADALLAYIRRYIPGRGIGLLAGSSVHADKAFLRKAPYDRVMEHLHYRILDVSTIKEAVRRWTPPAPEPAGGAAAVKNHKRYKESKHRARDDILDSIAEARQYKKLLFDDPAEASRSAAKK